MSDYEDFGCNSKIPEMEDHSFENNLQEELEDMLNYESEPEEPDLATDDNCILFENDQDNVEPAIEFGDPSTANNLQEELEDMLNYESEPEEPDLATDDNCILFESDLDSVEPDIEFGDPNTASLFKYGNKTVLTLTDEEKEVIKKCTDPVLLRCLILNRLKMQQLKHLRARLIATLNRCSDDTKKEQEELSQQNQAKASLVPAKTYIYKLGMPYFKDHEDYGAPPNIDCLKKLQNKEYSITEFSEGRRWVDEHQKTLRTTIEASYYKYCVLQLEGRIQGIERQIRKVDNDEEKKQSLQSDLNNAQQDFEALQSEGPYKTPPFGSDTGIDWLWIADIELKSQHTICECKAMWKIYLHPHINKNDWTPEENEQIQELAAKYNYQDWDSIAAELGTNRSGYLVCVHYHTKLCDRFKRDRFSQSEDEYLLEIIENCRLGSYIPWASVANFIEDRSKHQLYHRYKYYLSCKDMKKGIFSEAEDILLAHLVQRFGKDYPKASEFFSNRTSIQLRNRYYNYLEKLTINLGNFTFADDKKILDYVKVHGNKKWAALAQQLHRTRAHVRQRYLTLTKWMEKNPSLKVEEIPRRKQTSLSLHYSERQTRMLGILKKLAESKEVPSLPAVEALLKMQEEKAGPSRQQQQWRVGGKQTSMTPMDHKLMEFFKGTCRVQRESKLSKEDNLAESAQRVQKLMDLMGADVNILKDAEVEGKNSNLTDREWRIVKTIKEALNKDMSKADPLSRHRVKAVLPPNLNTLLGLRGVLVKYEVYKETTNTNFMSNVRLNSTKTALEEPMVWRMEQNLLKLDSCTQAQVKDARDLFLERYYALSKWPCLMSRKFPEQLASNETEDEEETTADPAGASKVGRPNRKSYPKVLMMLEAKKRQRGVPATIGGMEKQEQESNTELESEDGFQLVKKIKRPRALKPKKPKSTYTVRYLPRRAKTKKRPAKDEKLPTEIPSDPCSSSTGQLTDVGIQRVVNISDLKFPAAENVPFIDRNALLKLDQANGTSKIVILEKAPSVAPGKILPSPEETIAHPLPDISEDDPPQLNKHLKIVKQYIAKKSKQPIKTVYRKPNEPDIMKQEDDSDDEESRTFEDDLRALDAVDSKIKRETDAPEVMDIDNSFEEDLAMELQMNSLGKSPELTPKVGSSGVQLSAEIKKSWAKIKNKNEDALNKP